MPTPIFSCFCFLNIYWKSIFTCWIKTENCQQMAPIRVSYWTIAPSSVDQLKSVGSKIFKDSKVEKGKKKKKNVLSGCHRTLLIIWSHGMGIETVGLEIVPSPMVHRLIVWSKPPLKISRPDVNEGATCRMTLWCPIVEFIHCSSAGVSLPSWNFAKRRDGPEATMAKEVFNHWTSRTGYPTKKEWFNRYYFFYFFFVVFIFYFLRTCGIG